MKRLYFDSETCGLHGVPVLFQYAVEEGPVTLYDLWKKPVGETLDLIEWMLTHTMVFFNATFDMFHLCKTYTTFRLCPRDWIPEEHIDEIARFETLAQDGPCIKPVSTLDLMLYARKGPLQSLMSRDDIRIRKVPTVLSYALAKELEARVQVDSIYFARKSDQDAPKWCVYDRKDKWGDIDPDFKDVVLKFSPAGGLKYLAEYVLKLKPKYHFKDVEPPQEWRPFELGYAPTALALTGPERNWEIWGTKKTKPNVYEPENELTDALGQDYDFDHGPDDKLLGHAWPAVIKKHIDFWASNEPARDYATDDIVYTRALDQHFGYPEPGDDDSTLACAIAAIRWHGFKIDVPGIKKLIVEAQKIIDASPVNINKPTEVRAYISEVLDDVEKLVLETSTKKANVEAISNWMVGDENCTCSSTCPRCNHTGKMTPGMHPGAVRAKRLLAVKFASKEVELYTKLLIAGRFHASFVVVGTLSSRMAGADGLNAQGIKHSTDVRSMFPLAWDGMVLSIGDFEAFEITIADAVTQDPDLHAELLGGKKIHGLFGVAMFPGMTYEEVIATKGTDDDRYTKAKQGFFGSILYGGDHNTLVNKLGIKKQDAINAIEGFLTRYKGVTRWRQRVTDSFCSMKQLDGKQVIWKDPAEYAESFLGFRRYYSLENRICKTLFDLAHKPPKHWKVHRDVKVIRRDRVQSANGAVASALFGASFAMQAANTRSAANHEIQSPGAQITKSVQRRVWDLQPAGVNDWKVAILNIHDELATVSPPEMVDPIAETITAGVSSFRDKVPLIAMEWKKGVANWGEK